MKMSRKTFKAAPVAAFAVGMASLAGYLAYHNLTGAAKVSTPKNDVAVSTLDEAEFATKWSLFQAQYSPSHAVFSSAISSTPAPTDPIGADPSAKPSASPSPSVSPSASPSPSPSNGCSATASDLSSVSFIDEIDVLSGKPKPKPSPKPSASPSTKPKPSPTSSACPSPKPSASPSTGPSASPSASPSSSPSASASPSGKPSASPSGKPSASPSSSASSSPSPSPSPSNCKIDDPFNLAVDKFGNSAANQAKSDWNARTQALVSAAQGTLTLNDLYKAAAESLPSETRAQIEELAKTNPLAAQTTLSSAISQIANSMLAGDPRFLTLKTQFEAARNQHKETIANVLRYYSYAKQKGYGAGHDIGGNVGLGQGVNLSYSNGYSFSVGLSGWNVSGTSSAQITYAPQGTRLQFGAGYKYCADVDSFAIGSYSSSFNVNAYISYASNWKIKGQNIPISLRMDLARGLNIQPISVNLQYKF